MPQPRFAIAPNDALIEKLKSNLQEVRARGGVLENFTRIETYGYPFEGWVKLVVDEKQPGLFAITPFPR